MTRLFLALLFAATGAAAAAQTPPPAAQPAVANAATQPGTLPGPVASTNPADEEPPQQQSRLAPSKIPFGKQLYYALENPQGDAPFGFLRDAINSQSGLCPVVKQYQREVRPDDILVYKVKCSKRQPYLVTVDRNGRLLLDGGNGSVSDLRPSDGQIVSAAPTAAGEEEEDPEDKLALSGNKDDQIPIENLRNDPTSKLRGKIITPADQNKWLRWVLPLIIVAIAGVAGWLYARFRYSGRYIPSAMTPLRFPSDVKDRMISESREVRPEFYYHSTGIYIIRGRHGKRRVFDNRLLAEAYYRWGFKLGQLR